MVLATYFRDPGKTCWALKQYQHFAEQRTSAWSIRDSKLENYKHGAIAFDPAGDRDQRQAAFQRIYDQLKGYWQVFRPGQASWDDRTLFNVLNDDLSTCNRTGGLTLANLSDDGYSCILDGLDKLRGLKKMQYYPIMAVSKFAHFFNPKLFPIFDTSVISNQVLGDAFASEWNAFYYQFQPTAHRLFQSRWASTETRGLQDPITYIAWAAKMIGQRHASLMDDFSEWFMAAAGASAEERALLPEIKKYYATAFEYIAIGAMSLELGK
jgi:hypothetical protein